MSSHYANIDIDLNSLAEKHQAIAAEHSLLAAALRTPPTDDEGLLIRIYLKLRCIRKVAESLRSAGINKPNGRTYQNQDVSAAIQASGNTSDPIELALSQAAKAQLIYGRKLQPRFGNG